MNVREYAEYDATGLAELIRRREVTADEVYAVAVAAIKAVDEKLNAVAHGPWEHPLEYGSDGPFAGVPFVLKDLGAHPAGVPVKSGSRLSGDGVVFESESYLISGFRRVGLASAAMTTAPEFGYNPNTEALAYGGSTRNPWNLERSAGGSSGGSGALVAAGAVPLAHAGDGGGSTRIPAAYNGLIGLKPTRGRTSSGPDAQDALLGLGVEFAITRTMRDCAALLDAVAGAMPGDHFILRDPVRPWSEELRAPAGRLRVAVNTGTWSTTPVDPEVVAAVERVARTLEGLGHRVEPVQLRFDWDAFVTGMTTLMAGFLLESIDSISAATGNQPGPDTLEHTIHVLYEHGRTLGILDLAKARQSLNAVSRTVGDVFTQWDLLLTPTTNVPPPPLGYQDANDPSYDAEGWTRRMFEICSFTPLLNWAGTPAISLPLGWSSDGLPIGVQLAAPMCEEAILMRVGAQLEEAMPWSDRRAPLHAANLVSAS